MRVETARASWTFSYKKTIVKGIPIIGHKDPRGMWMQGCTYLCIHSHGTWKRYVGWLVLRLAAFTRGTHFIVGWVDTRSSLDIKDWRKSSPLRHTESTPGRRARSQAHCHLSQMTPLRKPSHEYNHLFPTLKKHIFSVMLLLSLVSAKLTFPPPSSCHKRRKKLHRFVNIRVEKL